MITTRSTCRACGGPFDALLDLGTPVLSDFLRPDEPDPPRAPLDVVVCQKCELVQLRHTVDPESLYRKYWYRSSVNEAMRAELEDVASTVRTYIPPPSEALDRFLVKPRVVLDIGANDGYLLSCFDPKHWNRVGVEPARNIQPLISASQWLNDFFPHATRNYVDHCCDAICSVAMFYDVDDPKAFVAEIDRLLTPDGVWIVQMQDLGQMVQTNAFDNLVCEHLCHYTPETFQNLLRGFDLTVVAIQPRAINGGSLRFIVRRQQYAVLGGDASPWSVSRDALDHFAWRVGQYKDQLLGAIDHALSQDLHLDLYAASTKSSTLLQYCGIDHRRIRYAVERSPEKVGLVTSGTRIPIVSEDDWRKDPAPLCLLGAWQWAKEFTEREHAYLEQGGGFLVPLPSPRIIYGSR